MYSHELKKLSIIVPSLVLKRKKNPKHFYRKLTSLPDLLESVEKYVKVDSEIVLIVNGDVDPKLEPYVRSKGVNKYCINNLNTGVSRAWNIGRQLSEGEYLLYISDDVTLGEGAVEKMIATLDEEPEVGVVGHDGGMWKNGGYTQHGGFTEPTYVDVILGYCFMVRAKDFDKVGGFDVNFTPAGMEEVDFCISMGAHGLKIKVLPEIKVFTEPRHGISARSTKVQYFNSEVHTEELHERNKEYFKNKWGDKA